MPTKDKTSVFGRLGPFGAAFALLVGGWGLHVGYQRLDQHIETSTLSNRLVAAEIQIDTLQAALEQEKKEREDVTAALQKEKEIVAGMRTGFALIPTPDDWTALCTITLQSAAESRRVFAALTPDMVAAPDRLTLTLNADPQKLPGAFSELQLANKMLIDTLAAARLLGYKDISGERWYYFFKNPALLCNLKTGQLKQELPSTRSVP